VFVATYILTGVFILSITDSQFTMQRLVFEEVSAFCAVSLSTGITSELSQIGKVLIISCMFVGMVGILTLTVALSTMVPTTAYKYPRARLIRILGNRG
jgi:Trk-type K+ transport system membrane component